MAVKINGDALSILARSHFSNNVFSLSASVEKLSSGLRINRFADDPATSTIASQLNSEALSLGQAVRNANDGVSVMQIVDGALAEVIDIVNTIRTKAVSGAQDTLTTASRLALQGDINTLLGELDSVADNAVFNDQNLLSGLFSNKQFQIGASANQAVGVSFPRLRESTIGHLGAGALTLSSSTGGAVSFNLVNPDSGLTLNISSFSIAYSNDADSGMGGLADRINRYTSDTGISASAVVESISSSAINVGSTLGTFAINDIAIGSVSVSARDADSTLINAINAKTTSHGVTASVSSSGQLSLSSGDGRAIKVSGLGSELGSSDDELSTYGQVNILQVGPYSLDVTDLSDGFAVAFSSNMNISQSVTTSIDSVLAPGSVLGDGSLLAAGSTAGGTFLGADVNGAITTTQDSRLLAGSVVASGSTIAAGSRLGGTAVTGAALTGLESTVLQSGSVLNTGSVVKSGSYLTNDITTASGPVVAGTVLSGDATVSADLNLTYAMLLLAGSQVASGSSFTEGSIIGADFSLDGVMSLSKDMTLSSGSTLVDVDGSSSIAVGSTIGGEATIASSVAVTREMIVKGGSVLSSSTEFAMGSTIGGEVVLAGSHTAVEDILLESGSILASSSTIKSETLVTTPLITSSGTIAAGTTLAADVITNGSNTLSNSLLVKSGSALANGSILAANSKNEASVQVTGESRLRLIDLSVLSAEESNTAIAIADAALADIERVRAAAGAYQSRFESSISLLGETQMQVIQARSKMVEVDFASEVDNFTRMQLLMQTSAFALTQANAVPPNVFKIFQGGTDQNMNQFFIAAANNSRSIN